LRLRVAAAADDDDEKEEEEKDEQEEDEVRRTVVEITDLPLHMSLDITRETCF